MDTTLHTPDLILADLIKVIDKPLGKGRDKPGKGAEWGAPGNVLNLEAAPGIGVQAFIHCKDKSDFDAIYTDLTGTLKLSIKDEIRCLTEYSGKGNEVKGQGVSFFSVYLQVRGTETVVGQGESPDSLGVIHNPNY